MTAPEDVLALVRQEPRPTRWGLAPHPDRDAETWWYAYYGGLDVTEIAARLKREGWSEAFYRADRMVFLRPCLPEERRDDDLHANALVANLRGQLQAVAEHLRSEAAAIEALLRRFD